VPRFIAGHEDTEGGGHSASPFCFVACIWYDDFFVPITAAGGICREQWLSEKLMPGFARLLLGWLVMTGATAWAYEIEDNPHVGLQALGKSIDIRPTLELQMP
jgi:hypothetical protein